MDAARMAGLSGWHWLAAMAVSVAVHGAVLVNVRPATTGVRSPPAGKPVSVAGTLAGVLGNASVAGEARDAAVKPADSSKPVPEPRPDTIRATPPAKVTEPKASAQTSAKSTPSSPAPPVVAPAAPTESTVASAAPMSPSDPPPKIQPTPQSKPPSKSTPKTQAKPIKRREKTRRSSARRSGGRVGTRRQGAGGRQHGGRGGVRTASAGAMSRYGMRVRARILANRQGGGGLRGRAVISFGVSSSGGLRYVTISRSSGNRSVDRAALQTVRRASPFPRPPQTATLTQLRFSIPFTFE